MCNGKQIRAIINDDIIAGEINAIVEGGSIIAAYIMANIETL